MSNNFDIWKKHLSGTPDGQALAAMPPEELADAFSGDIAFGTGGLRGIMGLGTNRMNRYTVERVTHGLARVIMSGGFPKSVCVAFDTRFNSAEFAQIVCNLLSAYGIVVYTFSKPAPTPLLSFAVRHLGLGWGVVITASHNPQEYNGYKIYDSYGVQLTDQMANAVAGVIESAGFFEPVPEGRAVPVNIFGQDIENAYRERLLSFVGRGCGRLGFPIVYSALHGAGAGIVSAVLSELVFSPVCIQQNPDGAFGGMKTPNPEEPVVYSAAVLEAQKCGAKLLLATDPDCDRVGVMIRTQCGFEPLSGNQIGALLIDYLIQARGATSGGTVITTIVSGLLGEFVSKASGLEFKRLLTGFKYIGECIGRLPEGKSFFFGYEESYGFLAGDGARDKDAVIASALIAQMAAFYDNKGKTLLDRWLELSQKHGFCLEVLHSINATPDRQKELMAGLRDGASFEGLVRIEDYLHGLQGLPPSDVLKLYFAGGAWAAIRPSGTEPKLKIYAGVCEKTHELAKARIGALSGELLQKLKT